MWREVGCLGMGMLSSFGFVALLHHRARAEPCLLAAPGGMHA